MDKMGVVPIKNNASNLAGLRFSFADRATSTSQPLMLRNNGFSNSVSSSSNIAARNSFIDDTKIDRKGKRKIVNEIDFFSSEKRKMPKLEPGIVSASVPRIKEEDITLQIGLQFTRSTGEEESLQQAYKRVTNELAVTKAELRRMGEEKSIMREEINQLKNMVAGSDKFYYPIALVHKANHEATNHVISSHALQRMIIEKQHRENYQVSETSRRLRLV